MSDGTIRSGSGTASEAGKDLVRGLPPYFPKDEQSGNFHLLDVVGRAIERMDADLKDVDRAATLQHADTTPSIEQIAEIVQVDPKSGESKDKYRARVLGEFQTLTSEGTVGDMLINASVILNTDIENLIYERLEPGYFSLKVPGKSIDLLALTDAEFAEIMAQQAAAGYTVDVQKLGTFTYIRQSQYEDTNFTHDPDKGYDGLDANGDPKGNGGTYSGILE